MLPDNALQPLVCALPLRGGVPYAMATIVGAILLFLVIFVLLAVGVSFLCSIMEAVLLSITPSFVAKLESEEGRQGRDLHPG